MNLYLELSDSVILFDCDSPKRKKQSFLYPYKDNLIPYTEKRLLSKSSLSANIWKDFKNMREDFNPYR